MTIQLPSRPPSLRPWSNGSLLGYCVILGGLLASACTNLEVAYEEYCEANACDAGTPVEDDVEVGSIRVEFVPGPYILGECVNGTVTFLDPAGVPVEGDADATVRLRHIEVLRSANPQVYEHPATLIRGHGCGEVGAAELEIAATKAPSRFSFHPMGSQGLKPYLESSLDQGEIWTPTEALSVDRGVLAFEPHTLEVGKCTTIVGKLQVGERVVAHGGGRMSMMPEWGGVTVYALDDVDCLEAGTPLASAQVHEFDLSAGPSVNLRVKASASHPWMTWIVELTGVADGSFETQGIEAVP